MVRQPSSYSDFVTLFGSLSPFELAHFSEIMFVKFEDLLADEKASKRRVPFSVQDVEYVMTRTIRDIGIELADRSAAEARLRCDACPPGTGGGSHGWQDRWRGRGGRSPRRRGSARPPPQAPAEIRRYPKKDQ